MNSYSHYLIDVKWQKIFKYVKSINLFFITTLTKDNKYSIDVPPPTVSGILHMGHLLSYTQIDFIVRFNLLRGKIVFFSIGLDNNGLPTEKLLKNCFFLKEKEIFKLEFFLVCKEIIKKKEREFNSFFTSIGLNIDYFYSYKTIDYFSQKLSQISFIDLYFKKYLLKVFWPAFWDISDQTVVSQAEQIEVNCFQNLHSIVFYLNEKVKLFICLSRPEFFFSCIAIFFNNNDLRYKFVLGKIKKLFFYNFFISIFHSDNVDINYATGLLICSTFSDYKDLIYWQKNNLFTIECFKSLGRIKNSFFLNHFNLTLANNFSLFMLGIYHLLSFTINTLCSIKFSEKSKTKLELILTSQWYIKSYFLDLHKLRKIKWYPNFMSKKLFNWIKEFNNFWCISRQRYFGIYFPIWYSKKKVERGKILLPDINSLPVNPCLDLPFGYTTYEVKPEIDLIDTWFTSAITPQILSYFIFRSLSFNKFCKNNTYCFELRCQGHEIIRTWTFYSLLRSFVHKNCVPWLNLIISGWCVSKDGLKMSKSLNNIINPLKLASVFGVDILRYWVSTSNLGTDIFYNNSICKIASKFITKIINASRFVYLSITYIKTFKFSLQKYLECKSIICNMDKWIIFNLFNTIENTIKLLLSYEYFYARINVEKFFINDFCNNYLEVIKTRMYNSFKTKLSFRKKNSAISTLYFTFYYIINIFSPFFPHFTEEINTILYNKNYKLINRLSGWKNINNFVINKRYSYLGRTATKFLELIRKYKSINMIPLNSFINKIYISGEKIDNSSILDLKNVANCNTILYKNSLKHVTLISNCKNYLIQVSDK